MKQKDQKELQTREEQQIAADGIDILEEIEVEDLTVDGICGVY